MQKSNSFEKNNVTPLHAKAMQSKGLITEPTALQKISKAFVFVSAVPSQMSYVFALKYLKCFENMSSLLNLNILQKESSF